MSSKVQISPAAAVYQRQLSAPSLQGRLLSIVAYGLYEVKAQLIGAVVYLPHSRTAGPIIRYREQCIAVYRVAVPLDSSSQSAATSKIISRHTPRLLSFALCLEWINDIYNL